MMKFPTHALLTRANRFRFIGLILLLLFFTARSSTQSFKVPFTQFTLDNGLRVVLSEDHSAPVVAVAVYYDVGSRNEVKGRSGFAHLFEHMMFQGSENVGKAQHFQYVENNGGVLNGSFPTTHGEANLHWADGGRVVFLSYQDGWPHLYSLPASGGQPLLLTPGDFMAEHIALSTDRRSLVFAANAGSTPDDLHRRHVVRVPVDKAAVEVLTPGSGLEWSPVVTGDGQWVAYIAAGAQRPPLPAVRPSAGVR